MILKTLCRLVPEKRPSLEHQNAISVMESGLNAVDAGRLVEQVVGWEESHKAFSIGPHRIEVAEFDRIVVVGFGKASGWMASGLWSALDLGNPENAKLGPIQKMVGWINVPQGKVPAEWNHERIKIKEVRPLGVNLPTERALQGSKQIIDLVQSATDRDLIVCLISGGGSALFELLPETVSLKDLRLFTDYLSRSTGIKNLNTIRKMISQVKGGKLAQMANSKILISLILSDVIGDRPDLVASGPTFLNPSQSHQAWDVYQKLDPNFDNCPASIQTLLETQSVDLQKDPVAKIENLVIGDNQVAVRAATMRALELGFEVMSVDSVVDEMTTNQVGEYFAKLIVDDNLEHPVCIVSGGEAEVDVPQDSGAGGRNQHLILTTYVSLLKQEQPLRPFCLLSVGTDGEDGATEAAGAWINNNSLAMVRNDGELQAMAHQCWAQFDSHTFLNRIDAILKLESTRTNVCDLRILIIGENPNRDAGC